MFLTDGGVDSSQEEATIALAAGKGGGSSSKQRAAAAAAAATTLLCLGIGHGVHRSLLDRLASLSGGMVKYVLDGEDIGDKVGYLKKCSLAASTWTAPRLLARGALVRASPHVLPPRLFPGEPLQVSARLHAVMPHLVPADSCYVTHAW